MVHQGLEKQTKLSYRTPKQNKEVNRKILT